jgi:adenine-specific DNA-methyltransferase
VSRLTDLISKAKAKDPQMGADLEREFRALSSRLSFGLNFERHRPEAVELPQRPVRRGDKVRVLPERGSTAKGDQRLWVVRKIAKDGEKKRADIELLDESAERSSALLDDLVVVAEFRDIIYPGLVSTGKVSRGGDKPCHTVINGENFHVLKALTWTHRGKVDAIYIDPPYNTGAKDWKYNNDYVESDDLYRHSKWLAMMERRLLLAKELLNPAGSVLIVTIDEKEYLRLGLLLEQIFPEARVQMISSVINPAGSSRRGMFARTDEYIYFVLFGQAIVQPWIQDMLNIPPNVTEVRWDSLQRRGEGGKREGHPELFYAIYFDKQGRLSHCGDPLPYGVNVPEQQNGYEAVVPVKPDGTAMRWSISGPELLRRLQVGAVRYYKDSKGKWVIRFLQSGMLKLIESGEIVQSGADAEGFPRWEHLQARRRIPMTTWKTSSHSASDYATPMLSALLPSRHFPFPKSLFAVEDALRFFVADKPEAVVLDFFSGSGTTAHAVMRLNKQDGGKRQCISVTNNEVGAAEQKALRERRLRPGDPEWERLGICDYITKPRVQAAISGKTPDGKPIEGSYKFTDEFPMADGFEENAEFFTLTYETPVAVSYQTAFARIAPLLWLRAGSVGRRIEKVPTSGWDLVDTYGLLVNLDNAKGFLKATRKAEDLRIAYIVTDDERRFQALARRLPEGVEAIRLYESYLTNFAFANGDVA